MKRYIIAIVFLVCNTLIYCQESENTDININVCLGLTKYTSNDQLINYFNYSGKSFLPVNLNVSYCNNKNLFLLTGFFNHVKLYPKNLPQTFYEYNYIKQWHVELGFEFYRQVLRINKYLLAYIGVSNNSFLILQQEDYKNLLYDNSQGYRKSYDYSLINISPDLLINFNLHKIEIIVKAGYTLINYASRPDDNYVKQIGLKNDFRWKLYLPKTYTGIQFSLFYQYNLSKKMSMCAEYNVKYHSYSSPNACKYLQKSYLVGVTKSF